MTVALTKLLRQKLVSEATSKGRTTIYREIGKGLFTRPVSLGGGRVAWPAHEVEAINRARIAGATDDDIRELVAQLHAERLAKNPQVAA